MNNPHFGDYDQQIKAAVGEFNTRLGTTPRYVPLSWKLIKAIILTETAGPELPAWQSNPMQIGNPGDPGLKALLGGQEGGDLILGTPLKSMLSAGLGTPEMNIKAGRGYLLMRAASFGSRSVDDADSKVYEGVIGRGGSLDRFAKANGTTIEVLKVMNPGIPHILQPTTKLKYRKASTQKAILGWAPLTPAFAATKYNSGDPDYQKKVEHALTLVP